MAASWTEAGVTGWAVVMRAAGAALLTAAMIRARSPTMSRRASRRSSARMTLEEKVGQLNLISHGLSLRWDDIREGKAGALINFNNAQDVARAQALARETRL